MSSGVLNNLLFVIFCFCVGTYSIFFARSFCAKILERTPEKFMYGFVRSYYASHGVFKIRATGVMMYVMGGFILYQTFLR